MLAGANLASRAAVAEANRIQMRRCRQSEQKLLNNVPSLLYHSYELYSTHNDAVTARSMHSTTALLSESFIISQLFYDSSSIMSLFAIYDTNNSRICARVRFAGLCQVRHQRESGDYMQWPLRCANCMLLTLFTFLIPIWRWWLCNS